MQITENEGIICGMSEMELICKNVQNGCLVRVLLYYGESKIT